MKNFYRFLSLCFAVFLLFEIYLYTSNYQSNLIVRISNYNPSDTLMATTFILNEKDIRKLTTHVKK